MSETIRKKLPDIKYIIDRVEFIVAVPNSLYLHKMMNSDPKSHTILKVKALARIAPCEDFFFISSVYPRSISHQDITVKSGILNPHWWNPGEERMSDRGFKIEYYLSPMAFKLAWPSSLNGYTQFKDIKVLKRQQIANDEDMWDA